MSLVPSFLDLLQPLSCVMTAPSFESFRALITGWAFTRRCTVTGMIVAADAAVGHKHHSAYHRLFATARWSLGERGLAVGIWPADPAAAQRRGLAWDRRHAPARKRELKVFGVGMHHDPLLSTRKTAITNWGHCCWVVLDVIPKLPLCADRWFCLPILFRPYVPKKTARTKALPYHAKPQLAVRMLHPLYGRFAASRQFHAIGDSTYGGKSVPCKLPVSCGPIGRLKMDARLYEAPPSPRGKRKAGRPRRRGRRLPTPRQMLRGRCRRRTLSTYGRKDKSRVAECIARTSTPRPIGR